LPRCGSWPWPAPPNIPDGNRQWSYFLLDPDQGGCNEIGAAVELARQLMIAIIRLDNPTIFEELLLDSNAHGVLVRPNQALAAYFRPWYWHRPIATKRGPSARQGRKARGNLEGIDSENERASRIIMTLRGLRAGEGTTEFIRPQADCQIGYQPAPSRHSIINSAAPS
jgi:hypothetical protein